MYLEKKIKEDAQIMKQIIAEELSQRQIEIFSLLRDNKNTDFTILELTQKIDASRNTIKKDIEILITKKLIRV